MKKREKTVNKMRLAEKLHLFLLLDLFISTCFFMLLPLNWLYRRYSGTKLKRTSKVLKRLSGYFSLTDYYEGIDAQLKGNYLQPRMSGTAIPQTLNLSVAGQVQLLEKLASQVRIIPKSMLIPETKHTYEPLKECEVGVKFLDTFLKNLSPRNIIEIGSGPETLVVNQFLMKITIARKEMVSHTVFDSETSKIATGLSNVSFKTPSCLNTIDWESVLHAGDLLIIHPSKIYPLTQDRLALYKNHIPKLVPGVIVLFLDVYPSSTYENTWIRWQFGSSSEVDLLDVLLTNTSRYEVVAALDYLRVNFPDLLQAIEVDPKLNCGDVYFKVL